LGLPEEWSEIEKWAKKPFFFGPPIEESFSKEQTEFDGLDFSKKMEKSFWKKFPSRKLPKTPSSRIKFKRLQQEIKKVEKKWTLHQKDIGKNAIRNLSGGAPACQRKFLPGAELKNANSVYKHGAAFTKTLKKWILDEFVAGPFNSPPVDNFRTNSLMAVEQGQKVRPILNMSFPKDDSFNDNVVAEDLRKIRMSSAKQFGQSVRAAGKSAIMTKMDMKDAYKTIPARPEDYRLQGFKWGGAFFVETQMIFGSASSPANFDDVAKTVEEVAAEWSKTRENWRHRTLDDQAVVGPKGSGICEAFTKDYVSLCEKVNIKLAEDCPRKEKAFKNSTSGTVLGIIFDSEKMAWSVSEEKKAKIIGNIHSLIHGGHTDLKQLEETAGRLNHFGQMCPFLKAFKRPLNDLLGSFEENYDILLPITPELIEDLRVWAAVVANQSWLPIEQIIDTPPRDALRFVSDAAGGAGSEEWVGVASIGCREDDSFWFVCSGKWTGAILSGLDEKGAKFSSKMTMLETVGLLLPLLTVPEWVRNRNVILGVDNISVYFAWENKSCKGDLHASVLIRAIHIVSSFLSCRIFVEHVPRCSSNISNLADSLTRASTCTASVLESLGVVRSEPAPASLWSWLEDPSIDWNLGFKLVDELKNKL